MILRGVVKDCGTVVAILFDANPDAGEWYCRTHDGRRYIVFGVDTTVAQIEEVGIALFPGDRARLLRGERKACELAALVQDDTHYMHALNQVMTRRLAMNDVVEGAD